MMMVVMVMMMMRIMIDDGFNDEGDGSDDDAADAYDVCSALRTWFQRVLSCAFGFHTVCSETLHSLRATHAAIIFRNWTRRC